MLKHSSGTSVCMHRFGLHPNPSSRCAAPAVVGLLDAEIERYQNASVNLRSLAPWFAPKLECKFITDTNDARKRDLSFAIALGSFFYFLSAVTDIAFLPDAGLDGFWLRLIALPVLLAALIIGPRLRPRRRELLAAVAAGSVVCVLAVIPFLSATPQSAFALTNAMLALVYANTTLELRFGKACIFTLFSSILIVAMAILPSHGTMEMGLAITLQIFVAATFSLIANFRSERRERFTYLLATREALRAAALAADREKLTTLSNTDALTGLRNRGSFNRYCLGTFANPDYRNVTVAVIMIDVDHFKQYNDHHGHIAGDACLRAVAQQISSETRSNEDIVARYGGEEFIVLLTHITPGQAESLAQRICLAVQDLKLLHSGRSDGNAHVTVSVGVASGVVPAPSSIVDLIEAADSALYAAKRNGRNRCETAFAEAA